MLTGDFNVASPCRGHHRNVGYFLADHHVTVVIGHCLKLQNKQLFRNVVQGSRKAGERSLENLSKTEQTSTGTTISSLLQLDEQTGIDETSLVLLELLDLD